MRRLVFALPLLSIPAAGQTPAPLVQQGDDVPGIGNVLRIDNVVVNDSGDWIVEAITDHPNPAQDSVLIKNGVVVLREGDPVSAPAGAAIGEFDAVGLNRNGDVVWNFALDGTSSTADDGGIYFGSKLVIQEGTVSGAPQFAPGTVWQKSFDVKLNNLNRVLILSYVKPPSGPPEQALVIADLQPDGTLTAENLVYKTGDVLPGQTDPVAVFSIAPHRSAFNDADSVLFVANMNQSSGDRAIYLDSLLLAAEGSGSPVGLQWGTFYNASLDLNAGGEYVYTGNLTPPSGSNVLMVKNGAKLYQTGDSFPAIAPFSLTDFGTGPVDIDDGGDVLWYGEWSDPSPTKGAGFFVNDNLVVEQWVTVDTDGHTITNLEDTVEGYAVSENGRFLVFEAKRDDGIWGAYFVDLSGNVTPMSECAGNLSTLAHTGGTGATGDKIQLAMDSGQASGVFALVAYATQPAPGWPPCGAALPGIGELLLAVAAPNPVLVTIAGQPWTGGALVFDQAIPLDPTLVNANVYAQGLFADFAGVGSPAEPFRLTGGLEILIGP